MTELAQHEHPRTTPNPVAWPRRVNVFGVQVSITNYDEMVDCIIQAARARQPAAVSLFAVHALITASNDPQLKEKANAFQAVCPDGQPVRWALNWMHRAKLKDRVYGPELTLRVCEAAAREGVSIYLYGSTPAVLERLSDNLTRKFPGLKIAGAESPPFRPLTDEESAAMVERVNRSGAGVFFIGLGCPKQDHFAYDYRNRLNCVQVAVGAAFDFHAGTKRIAPTWMQRRGLEWLFRLYEEPKRLWKRYLVTNSVFVMKFLKATLLGVNS